MGERTNNEIDYWNIYTDYGLRRIDEYEVKGKGMNGEVRHVYQSTQTMRSRMEYVESCPKIGTNDASPDT